MVEESGIRGCLGKIVMDIARYANNSRWKMHPGMIETREQSLGGAIRMWEKWNGAANDRIRVWFAPRPPGGYVNAEPLRDPIADPDNEVSPRTFIEKCLPYPDRKASRSPCIAQR